MKICVIVNSFGAVIHVGGSIETFVREFEVSPEFAEYVEAQRKIGDCAISLAFMEGSAKSVPCP